MQSRNADEHHKGAVRGGILVLMLWKCRGTLTSLASGGFFLTSLLASTYCRVGMTPLRATAEHRYTEPQVPAWGKAQWREGVFLGCVL